MKYILPSAIIGLSIVAGTIGLVVYQQPKEDIKVNKIKDTPNAVPVAETTVNSNIPSTTDVPVDTTIAEQPISEPQISTRTFGDYITFYNYDLHMINFMICLSHIRDTYPDKFTPENIDQSFKYIDDFFSEDKSGDRCLAFHW